MLTQDRINLIMEAKNLTERGQFEEVHDFCEENNFTMHEFECLFKMLDLREVIRIRKVYKEYIENGRKD